MGGRAHLYIENNRCVLTSFPRQCQRQTETSNISLILIDIALVISQIYYLPIPIVSTVVGIEVFS